MFQITTGEKAIVGVSACMGAYVACQHTKKLYYSQAARRNQEYFRNNFHEPQRAQVGERSNQTQDLGRTDPLGELKAVADAGFVYGAVTGILAGAAIGAAVYGVKTEGTLKCTLLSAGAGGVAGAASSVSRRILRV
jgi:hypothetical protein